MTTLAATRKTGGTHEFDGGYHVCILCNALGMGHDTKTDDGCDD